MDSDDDRTLVRPTPAEWQLFEQEVAAVQARLDPASEVQHDVKVLGVLSRRVRQVDVIVRGTAGGQEFVIAIECKHYARRLGIGTVDEFAGKLLDLGVDRGVLFALNGLTAPAVARALGASVPRIALGDFGPPSVRPDYEYLFAGFGDCPNENCYTGDLHWAEYRYHDRRLRAGYCGACGTPAVECPECGEVDLLDSGCYACETSLSPVMGDKGSSLEGVEVVYESGVEATFR